MIAINAAVVIDAFEVGFKLRGQYKAVCQSSRIMEVTNLLLYSGIAVVIVCDDEGRHHERERLWVVLGLTKGVSRINAMKTRSAIRQGAPIEGVSLSEKNEGA